MVDHAEQREDLFGRYWWNAVESKVLDRLPPEVSTMIRLGGNYRISIVREGKHTFAIYYRGHPAADISDLIVDHSYRRGFARLPRTEFMVDRAKWLANHWGVRYSRKKKGRRY
jgi:hypothetical protein